MKIKFKKCFVVLIFIICCLICVGCASKVNNAMYIKSEYEHAKWEFNGQYYIINTNADLNNLLENESPEKFNDVFFDNNSLIVFKIVEDLRGSKSEIKSYSFKGKTIKINVKTIQKGQEQGKEYWWFILELNKDEIKNIEEVKIIKNKKEIMNDKNMRLCNEAMQCFLETKIQNGTPTATIDDVLLHRYLGIYNDCFVGIFLEKNVLYKSVGFEFTIEDLTFHWQHGHEILVYYDGILMNLPQAYNNKFISYNDVVKIYEQYY